MVVKQDYYQFFGKCTEGDPDYALNTLLLAAMRRGFIVAGNFLKQTTTGKDRDVFQRGSA